MGDVRRKARKDAIEQASEIGTRLTQATEAINKRLHDAEDAIVAFGLGVRASVPMPTLPGDDFGVHRELIFGKFNADWALIVCTGNPLDPDDQREYQPLLNASREVRFAAIDLLPQLVEEMVATAEAQVEEAEAKATALEDFLKRADNGIPF